MWRHVSFLRIEPDGCAGQVGHEEAALTPDRTFASLYVDPLLSLLNMQNPKTAFTVHQTTPK